MSTNATRAHIDAETLAAWADRGLSEDAAAAVELHLSNCDQCQEVLAAFVRSAPTAGAVIIPFWARRPVQWSAAGLAAAAALVAMVWIGRPPAVQVPESTVASRAVAPAEPPQDKPAFLPTPSPANAVTVDQLQGASASARVVRRRDSTPSPSKAAEKADLKRAEQAAPAPSPAAALVATAPPPLPAAPPTPPVTVTVTAAVPVVTPLGAAKPIPSQQSAMAEAMSDAFSAVLPIIEIAAPEPSPAMRMAAGGAGRGVAGTRALAQSPGSTRWRIVAGTRVERTVDAGATWTPLLIEPELKTPLLAGSAASQSICWLVGRDGVVLVTHDGGTFRRVSVPEAVHLTGVTAADGMRATVTAIDGRKFSTIDGGLTWK